jgi:hypothetical protein
MAGIWELEWYQLLHCMKFFLKDKYGSSIIRTNNMVYIEYLLSFWESGTLVCVRKRMYTISQVKRKRRC